MNYSNISNIDSNDFCYYNLPNHDSSSSSISLLKKMDYIISMVIS
jgi:hypothetical protein